MPNLRGLGDLLPGSWSTLHTTTNFADRTQGTQEGAARALERQKLGRRTPAKPSKDIREMMKPSDLIPVNWLDPLLTGPQSCLGKPPYSCLDIERLLNRLRERVILLEKPNK
jgi:hypothetical protein